MLDEFRNLGDNEDDLFDDDNSPLFDDKEELNFEDLDDYTEDDFDGFSAVEEDTPPQRASRRQSTLPTLGLTAQQRLVISFLLFMTTCLFSMLCLLVFQKMMI